jgi:hypothetical protein
MPINSIITTHSSCRLTCCLRQITSASSLAETAVERIGRCATKKSESALKFVFNQTEWSVFNIPFKLCLHYCRIRQIKRALEFNCKQRAVFRHFISITHSTLEKQAMDDEIESFLNALASIAVPIPINGKFSKHKPLLSILPPRLAIFIFHSQPYTPRYNT